MEESKLQNKGFVRWMSTREVVEISLKNINKKLKVIVILDFAINFYILLVSLHLDGSIIRWL